MNTTIRLAGCVLLGACGPPPGDGGGPVPARDAPPASAGAPTTPPPTPPPDPAACAAQAIGSGYPAALLRIGCGGGVEPGRATWSREGRVVTLAFPASAHGPVGEDLVSAWPPLDAPPWLGHRIESVAVLSGGRVRVRFGAPPGRAPPDAVLPGAAPYEPERIFADPRLSGAAQSVPGDLVRDARDAIDAADAGSRVWTRHDASVEYARSLGRPVQLVAFDRLYLVAFAGVAPAGEAAAAGGAIGADWVEWGASGARRPPSVGWGEVLAQCGGSGPADEAAAELLRAGRGVEAAGRAGAGAGAGRATVSHADGDRAAAQIAERVVSLALRGDEPGATVRTLARGAARLSVRPRAERGAARAPTDVAAVVAVHGGPGHICSLHAEVVRALAEWAPRTDSAATSVVLVGETALFETWRP